MARDRAISGALGACRGLGVVGACRPLRILANQFFERLCERMEPEGLQMKSWVMERLRVGFVGVASKFCSRQGGIRRAQEFAQSFFFVLDLFNRKTCISSVASI